MSRSATYGGFVADNSTGNTVPTLNPVAGEAAYDQSDLGHFAPTLSSFDGIDFTPIHAGT